MELSYLVPKDVEEEIPPFLRSLIKKYYIPLFIYGLILPFVRSGLGLFTELTISWGWRLYFFALFLLIIWILFGHAKFTKYRKLIVQGSLMITATTVFLAKGYHEYHVMFLPWIMYTALYYTRKESYLVTLEVIILSIAIFLVRLVTSTGEEVTAIYIFRLLIYIAGFFLFNFLAITTISILKIAREKGESANILEFAPVSIVITDKRGHIKDVSKHAEELYGYKADRLRDKHSSLLYYDDKEGITPPEWKGLWAEKSKKERYTEVKEKLAEAEPFTEFETQGMGRDKTPLPIRMLASYLKDRRGKIIGTIGINLDLRGIFEHRKDLKHLRSLTGLGPVSWRYKEVFQDIVKKAREILHADIVTLYRCVGGDNRDDYKFEPLPYQTGELYYKDIMKEKIEEDDIIWTLIDRNENYFCPDTSRDDLQPPKPRQSKQTKFTEREKIKSYAALLIKRGEKVVGILYINYRKKCRFEETQKTLIEAFSYFSSVAIQEAQAEASRERVFYDSAYSIGTPAHSILSIVDFMFKELNKMDKNEKQVIERFLIGAHASAKSLENLSSKLMIVRKYDRNILIERKRSIYVNEVLRNVIRAFSYSFKDSSISIRPYICDDKIHVKGDLDCINTLFTCIIENAIRYSKKLGNIQISLNRKENECTFMIQDDGIGIPDDEIDYIFRRGFRGRRAKEERIIGLGLGLFISKVIIENHYGTIKVASELGEGTTFVITLPIFEDKKNG